MTILQELHHLQNSISLTFDGIGITQEIRGELTLEELSPQEQDQLTFLIEKFQFSLEQINNDPHQNEDVFDQRLLLRLGNYFFLHEDLYQALEYYNLSNSVEENEWAYFNSARILQIQEQMDEAFEKYEQAIKLKPDFPQALRHQAEILNSQGDTKAALKILKKSQQLNPNDSETNKLLANYYIAHGEKKEALLHLKAIHHRDPDVEEIIEDLEKKKSFFNRIIGRFRNK